MVSTVKFGPVQFDTSVNLLVQFFFKIISLARLIKKKRMRPISSHLDRTSLVNRGFIIWDKTPKHDLCTCMFILKDLKGSQLHAKINGMFFFILIG